MRHVSCSPDVQVQMLGRLAIIADGTTLCLPTSWRARLLLSMLLFESNQTQSREVLAARFWPDASTAQARTNLRRELHHLRRSHPLLEGALQSAGDGLRWQYSHQTLVDVIDLERHILQANIATDALARERHLKDAVAVYKAPLLAEFENAWVSAKRSELEVKVQRAMQQLYKLHDTNNDYSSALEIADKLLSNNPLSEVAYRLKMAAELKLHDPAAALQTYRRCAEILSTELGVEPGTATQTMLHQARSDVRETQNLTFSLSKDRTAGSALLRAIDPPVLQLVGRERLMENGLATWRKALAGHFQLLIIQGQAGIGKTRLAEEILRQAMSDCSVVATSKAAEGALPFETIYRWIATASLRKHLDELPAGQAGSVGHLLTYDIFSGRRVPGSQDEPGEQLSRLNLFQAASNLITSLQSPALLFVDDLQWCDQDTIDWLGYLCRATVNAPVMIVAACREEDSYDNSALQRLIAADLSPACVTHLRLEPLPPAASLLLAEQANCAQAEKGCCQLSQAQAQTVVDRSGGIPILIIEWVKAQSESAQLPPANADRITLPNRIREITLQRLKSLSLTGRQILNLAAVAGNAVDPLVLSHATGLASDRIDDALDELWQRRLIQESANARFEFTHDTVRESAYTAIRPVRRRAMHRKVANSLRALYRHDPESMIGAIARHCEFAGDLEAAVSGYAQAATSTSNRFASRETVQHLDSAVRLLLTMPGSSKRDVRLAKLTLGILTNLQLLDGFSSPSMKPHCQRLHKLLTQVKDPIVRVQMLNRLRIAHSGGATLPLALNLAEQSLEASRQLGNELFTLEAWRGLGQTQFLIGRHADSHQSYTAANDSLARAVKSGEIDMKAPPWSVQMLFSWWPLTLWTLGHTDRATDLLRQARAMTTVDTNGFVGVTASQLRALSCISLNEAEMLQQELELQNRFHQSEDTFVVGGSQIGLSWAQIAEGDIAGGTRRMQETIDQRSLSGNTEFLPIWLAFLTEALLAAGDASAGLRCAERGLELAARTHQRCWDVELYRLKAEAMRVRGAPVDEVLAVYRQALETLEWQGAPGLAARLADSQAGSAAKSALYA